MRKTRLCHVGKGARMRDKKGKKISARIFNLCLGPVQKNSTGDYMCTDLTEGQNWHLSEIDHLR